MAAWQTARPLVSPPSGLHHFPESIGLQALHQLHACRRAHGTASSLLKRPCRYMHACTSADMWMLCPSTGASPCPYNSDMDCASLFQQHCGSQKTLLPAIEVAPAKRGTACMLMVTPRCTARHPFSSQCTATSTYVRRNMTVTATADAVMCFHDAFCSSRRW